MWHSCKNTTDTSFLVAFHFKRPGGKGEGDQPKLSYFLRVIQTSYFLGKKYSLNNKKVQKTIFNSFKKNFGDISFADPKYFSVKSCLLL